MSRFLDSPAPFNPRPMPKGWKSPLRTPLYRVVVETRDHSEPVAVSPGLLREHADRFADVIRKQIKMGFETRWTNPTVTLCHL